MNEKKLRLCVFFIAVTLHLVIIFFFVFETGKIIQEESETARVMKLADLAEIPPVTPTPPVPPPEPEIPQVEDIAEIMIETDIPPVQSIETAPAAAVISHDVYLPMHLVSTLPQFDEKSIVSDIIYPPIALRSGIEGRVILELLIDYTGAVQRVIVVREEPQGRGFGEAAVRVFSGRKGKPATANGEPVSCRFRYPITFTAR
jgi:protein TonB